MDLPREAILTPLKEQLDPTGVHTSNSTLKYFTVRCLVDGFLPK